MTTPTPQDRDARKPPYIGVITHPVGDWVDALDIPDCE